MAEREVFVNSETFQELLNGNESVRIEGDGTTELKVGERLCVMEVDGTEDWTGSELVVRIKEVLAGATLGSLEFRFMKVEVETVIL